MANKVNRGQPPGLVFQPETYRRMQAGINLLVGAIRPTLGPIHKIVAIEKIAQRNSMPELLDSGGVIARRIIQLQNRDEDMGCMFLRNVLWEQQEKVGDGTATCAVIFQSIFNQGVRYIAAGGNAMRLRIFLEEAARQVLNEIERMKFHLEGKEALTRLAMTICHDPEMARMMGEIFDILGEYGRLEIRKGSARFLEREYVEGMYWDGGLVSREMINDPQNLRASLDDALILISDLEIKEPAEFLPLLELAVKHQINRLVLLAAEVTDRAISTLLTNKERVEVIVVKIPGNSLDDRIGALEDLAVLTGGKPLLKSAGDQLKHASLDNLGKSRRFWANMHNLVIVGGKGDSRVLRKHIAQLRAAYANASDTQVRKKLLVRIGKLLGGSATLFIGDISPVAVDTRKELAEHTAEAMRGAMLEGVIPGGGVSLFNCRVALAEGIQSVEDVDRRAAFKILYKALEVPMRVILENAGEDSHEIMAEVKKVPRGWGYDVQSRTFVDMASAGICDSSAVLRESVFRAVHGAALALTTDVLVHRRIRPESIGKTS
jgi:chaperonin GroEL